MRTRTVLGYTAAACALPYLTLKLLWVSGNYVGVNTPGLLDTPTMITANAVTGGLEVVGVLVALALAQSWGLRLPAWLVAFPMWVGTGLLAPIAIGFPLAITFTDLNTSPASAEDLDPWVYLVVYGGFTLQGVALTAAFAFYCRDRWGTLLRADVGPGVTVGLQRLLARLALVLVAMIAVVSLYWAFGGEAGLPDNMRAAAQQWLRGVEALLAVSGGLGLWLMVRARRFALGAALAWVGAGSMFGWGAFSLLAGSSMASAGDQGWVPLVDAYKLVASIVIGIVAAFVLVERAAAVGTPTEVHAKAMTR
ncbi:hypothetical protein [Longispora urticae]